MSARRHLSSRASVFDRLAAPSPHDAASCARCAAHQRRHTLAPPAPPAAHRAAPLHALATPYRPPPPAAAGEPRTPTAVQRPAAAQRTPAAVWRPTAVQRTPATGQRSTAAQRTPTALQRSTDMQRAPATAQRSTAVPRSVAVQRTPGKTAAVAPRVVSPAAASRAARQALVEASSAMRRLRRERDEARGERDALRLAAASVRPAAASERELAERLETAQFELDEARAEAEEARNEVRELRQAAIAARAERYAAERAPASQAAQDAAQRDSELREARIAANEARKQLARERRRADAAEKQRDAARAELAARGKAAAVATVSGSGVGEVQRALQRQPWFRGFTAAHAEWRLADVLLDANALILQRHVVQQLARSLPAHAFALRRVDLSRTGLVAGDCVHVAALAGAGRAPLDALQLDGNTFGDAGVAALAAAFADAPRAVPRHLSLRACALGWRACASLGALVHGAPRLRALNVSHNELRERGGQQLARAVELDGFRSGVTSVAARGCALGAGAAALAAAAVALDNLSLDLAAPYYEQTERDVDNRDALDEKPDGDEQQQAEAAAAAAAQRSLNGPGVVDERDVQVRLGVVRALASALYTQAQRARDAAAAAAAAAAAQGTVSNDGSESDAEASMLGYLSSWWRADGGAGIEPPSPQFAATASDASEPGESGEQRTASLRSLSLSIAQLGSIGLASLADALRHNRSLTRLRLTKCDLNDECAQLLFGALGEQPLLRELDLSSNAIGDYGAQFLAELLTASHVHVLDLERNRIGPSGAGAISAAVRRSASLHSLSLARNPLRDGVAALAGAVEHAPVLSRVDLRGIDCTAVCWLALEEAVARRSAQLEPIDIYY